jgi:hypothetical protein
MKHDIRTGAAAIVGLLLSLLMLGCELSEDTSSSSDVAGTWLYSDTDGRQSTWALAQTDSGAVSGAGTDGETISGTVTSDSIYMSVRYSSSNSATSLNGTISSSTMSGSFTNSLTGSGSWTAVKTS